MKLIEPANEMYSSARQHAIQAVSWACLCRYCKANAGLLPLSSFPSGFMQASAKFKRRIGVDQVCSKACCQVPGIQRSKYPAWKWGQCQSETTHIFQHCLIYKMARNVSTCYKNIDFEICVFFEFELRAQTALSKVVFPSPRND